MARDKSGIRFNQNVMSRISGHRARFCSQCFSSPVSSLVFGTNALFTKPAQSLAPMLVVAILSSYGYEVSRILYHR